MQLIISIRLSIFHGTSATASIAMAIKSSFMLDVLFLERER